MAINHKKLILAAFLAAASAGIANLLSATPTYADQAPIHLQVSPVKQKLSIEPGASYTSSFKVQNVGSQPFNYSTEAVPYSTTDENYSPDYMTISTYSQVSSWITFDSKYQTGHLEPGETIDVPFIINVPKDVPSGGQYAAIMAQTEDGNADDANIRVVNRVGMILYVNVPGQTRTEGSIIDNKVPGFLFEPPVTVTALVENTGNVESTAEYTLKIWPLFSNETVYNNEENPGTLDIMPETRRFSTISWDGAPRLGIFTVEQTIKYIDQVSTVKKLVIICPIWLLFIILALVFFMIFWLISRARGRKRAASDASAMGGNN